MLNGLQRLFSRELGFDGEVLQKALVGSLGDRIRQRRLGYILKLQLILYTST